MTIAEYMVEALWHPSHGYYANRDPLGARGDFITAPEISQIFGELIGLWCAELWQRMGAPDPVIVAELGPGRGTLMADALRAAQRVPAFRRAVRLHLVERSPKLRAAQAGALAAAEPHWHDDIATLPAGPLLLIANEFLDALPIRQLQRVAASWHERRIGLAADGASLAFVLESAPSLLAGGLPPEIAHAPAGSIAALSPVALSIGRDLGARLAAHGGAALFIDYGYYPSACGDTLQAVRRHRRHEVLAAPGAADLTAHVDFAAFAGAARAAGACAFGPVTQGAFLATLGAEARVAALLRNAAPHQVEIIRSGYRRLIAHDEMGTLFKALALTDKHAPVPLGFEQDAPP